MKNYQKRHYEEFYLMLSDGSSIKTTHRECFAPAEPVTADNPYPQRWFYSPDGQIAIRLPRNELGEKFGKDNAADLKGDERDTERKNLCIGQTSHASCTVTCADCRFNEYCDSGYRAKNGVGCKRISLTENASHISVCRGWQSTLDTGVDQGLIVGYLRDSKVFYRAYCQQSNGEYIWETENEVTELGIGNTTLCVFRTNDFRVGFLTENTGEMKYVLSERTYAGQAMPPEYAEGWPLDAKIWINNVQYYYPVFSEHGTAIPDRPYLACYSKDEPALAVVEHERIGLREIVMTFNRPVGGIPGAFENYFTTFPVRPVESCVWQNGNQLKLTLAQDLGQSVDFTITVKRCHEAWQVIGGHRMPIEATVFILDGFPIQTILRETATVTPTAGMYIDRITKHFIRSQSRS